MQQISDLTKLPVKNLGMMEDFGKTTDKFCIQAHRDYISKLDLRKTSHNTMNTLKQCLLFIHQHF